MNLAIKPKYFAFILITITLATSLWGCGANPKNFTKSDLTVTLNTNFEESSKSGFDVYIISSDVIFSATREDAGDLEYAGYEINSLQDYCYEILTLNGASTTDLVKRNDYYYFVDNKVVDSAEYTYFHCMYKGNNSYWICEFVCKAKNYDIFEDSFLIWADSIKIED